jgi:hypothetical protein
VVGTIRVVLPLGIVAAVTSSITGLWISSGIRMELREVSSELSMTRTEALILRWFYMRMERGGTYWRRGVVRRVIQYGQGVTRQLELEMLCR